ncbi:MAG: hypothetical protein PHE21_01850 [Candidatus Dojkabacteria bacterium]|nr:hypothetical protein [Candidatus Dojkabacteria bacterium]
MWIKIKTFLKNNYGYILLAILLISICIISFVGGKYILSNDNYSPELNPLLSIKRYLLNPAWRSYRGLGIPSDSEQADIFRSILFLVGSKVFSTSILSQLYYLLCLCLGSIFTGLFVKELVRESPLHKYNQLGFLLSGLVYIGTLWTVWTFYQTISPFVSNFGFLPIMVYAIYKYIKVTDSKNGFILLISSIFFSATSVISTLFIVDIVFLVFFALTTSILVGKKPKVIVKKFFKSIGLFLLTQLFWILPFIFYVITNSGDIVSSTINRGITGSVIDLETEMQTGINTLRLYSRILTDSNGKSLLFSYASNYLTYDFYKYFGLLPSLLSLICIPFIFVRKNYKLLVFVLVLIGCWFVIKVSNPPLGNIFTWLQDNVPLFKQVFRWPSSKLYEIFLIGISVLAPFGFIYLIDFLSSFVKKKFLKILLFVISLAFVILPQIIYSEYIFKGKLFSQNALVQVPDEYYKLKEYLYDNDTKGRIYYAPPSNNNYFREYNWGFRGSQFISYIVPNPMMDISLTIGSNTAESAMINIQNAFRAGNKDGFVKLLNTYDVDYVLVDKSIVLDGFTFDIDWSVSEVVLSDLESIWSDNFLTLYKVSDLDNTLVETNITEGFKRDESIIPNIYPYSYIDTYKKTGGSLLGKFKYNGKRVTVSNNVEDIDWMSFPTSIIKDDETIKISPAYPKIVQEEQYLKYANNTYDLYAIGGNVFTVDQLVDGVNVQTEYSELKKIYGITNSSFSELSLTDKLSQSTGSNCQDGSSSYSVSIIDMGKASGFTLKGEGSKGCVYSNVSIKNLNDYILKLNLNWEADGDVRPGVCIYSHEKDSCLNREKYITSSDSFGDIEILVPVVIDEDDLISIVLYSYGSSDDFEITFRKVSVLWSDKLKDIPLKSNGTKISNEQVVLEDGEEYTIQIPLLYGTDSYIYDSESSGHLVWESNSDGEAKIYTNMRQSIKDGYINQSVNMFSTEPLTKYLLYWKGENISNIPANICLLYNGQDSCWIQDVFYEQGYTNGNLKFFDSDASYTNRLDAVMNSTSYTKETENALHEFVVMKSPSLWDDIVYKPTQEKEYSEIQMEEIGDWGIYTTRDANVAGNILVSIPQSKSSGWVGIAKNDIGLSILEKPVTIRGWKQGWDVSHMSYTDIYVIFWPNILAYIGYVIIIILGLILSIKLIIQISKRHGR